MALFRLQQILIGRSLALSLEDIRRSLDDPSFDAATALRRQRARLVARVAETHRIIASIDATLTRLEKKEEPMSGTEVFDGFTPAQYQDEAKERWGHTDEYTESAWRTRTYGEQQWAAIKTEANAILADSATAMKSGAKADGSAAKTLAERHRRHIDRWFYPLTPVAHAHLADMWEADERFRSNIDKFGEGLTAWLATAVRASTPEPPKQR